MYCPKCEYYYGDHRRERIEVCPKCRKLKKAQRLADARRAEAKKPDKKKFKFKSALVKHQFEVRQASNLMSRYKPGQTVRSFAKDEERFNA